MAKTPNSKQQKPTPIRIDYLPSRKWGDTAGPADAEAKDHKAYYIACDFVPRIGESFLLPPAEITIVADVSYILKKRQLEDRAVVGEILVTLMSPENYYQDEPGPPAR